MSQKLFVTFKRAFFDHRHHYRIGDQAEVGDRQTLDALLAYGVIEQPAPPFEEPAQEVAVVPQPPFERAVAPRRAKTISKPKPKKEA